MDTRLHQKISLRLMTSRYQPVEGAAVVVEGEVPGVPRNQLHFELVNYAYEVLVLKNKFSFFKCSILYTLQKLYINNG